MKKVLVECGECSVMMVGNHMEGVRCYECGGYTLPLGYVSEFPKKKRNNQIMIEAKVNATEIDIALDKISKLKNELQEVGKLIEKIPYVNEQYEIWLKHNVPVSLTIDGSVIAKGIVDVK